MLSPLNMEEVVCAITRLKSNKSLVPMGIWNRRKYGGDQVVHYTQVFSRDCFFALIVFLFKKCKMIILSQWILFNLAYMRILVITYYLHLCYNNPIPYNNPLMKVVCSYRDGRINRIHWFIEIILLKKNKQYSQRKQAFSTRSSIQNGCPYLEF